MLIHLLQCCMCPCPGMSREKDFWLIYSMLFLSLQFKSIHISHSQETSIIFIRYKLSASYFSHDRVSYTEWMYFVFVFFFLQSRFLQHQCWACLSTQLYGFTLLDWPAPDDITPVYAHGSYSMLPPRHEQRHSVHSKDVCKHEGKKFLLQKIHSWRIYKSWCRPFRI